MGRGHTQVALASGRAGGTASGPAMVEGTRPAVSEGDGVEGQRGRPGRRQEARPGRGSPALSVLRRGVRSAALGLPPRGLPTQRPQKQPPR